jgi:hypothetical protein
VAGELDLLGDAAAKDDLLQRANSLNSYEQGQVHKVIANKLRHDSQIARSTERHRRCAAQNALAEGSKWRRQGFPRRYTTSQDRGKKPRDAPTTFETSTRLRRDKAGEKKVASTATDPTNGPAL